jgi:lincosamide nucleotidyltransferase A/C/D/E
VLDTRFGWRHSRWRAWLRINTPTRLYDLGLVVPKARDCGDHDWYNSNGVTEACYHCLAERSRIPFVMDATEVLRVLGALEKAGVRPGVTGGWGIDALLRRQTRPHGDVDLGVPSDAVVVAIEALGTLGYAMTADERPARVVLASTKGKVDLHPIVTLPSGAGVQTGFDGQTFEYPPGSLEAEGEIGGRMVRCGTPDLQVTFHRGYEPREHDRRDMAALARAFDLTLGPPYSG